MKITIIIFLLLLAANLFGQTMREKDIVKYARSIDALKANNALQKVSYPDMSACGGGLYGYYHNKQLVLIDATYQAGTRLFFKDNLHKRYFVRTDRLP